MSIVQTLTDRLLARAARLAARVEEPSKPAPVNRAQLQAETQAYESALAALARHDVRAALAALEPVTGAALKADTLLLNAHLLLLNGANEDARANLERAVALEPGNVSALDSLATLLSGQGAPVEEYRIRRQRLLAPAAFGPRDVIDAAAALARAAASSGELEAADLELITRQFDRIAASASTEERIEFAEWLFTLKPGRGRARTLIEQNITRDPAWGTRILALTSQAELPAADVLRRHEKGDDGLDNVWLRAAELADAAVFPDLQWSPWLPHSGKILRGYATRRGLTTRQQPSSTLLMQNNRQLLARLPLAKPDRIEGAAILIGSVDNHHRFLVEHLSRVATLAAFSISTEGARWIVGKNLPPYQRDYFALLGVPAEQLLPVDAHDNLVFAHLIAPTPLGRGARQLSALMPRWAREVLAPKAGAKLATQPLRRVYLSAAGGSGRRISNEGEVVAWLESRGFENVREQDLDVAALIRLFAQSCELVTPLGPALTHMLFMPEGARVTALYNSHQPSGSEGLEFDYVARACGHKLQAVPGAPAAQPGDQGQDVDFEVKMGDLAAAFGLK